MADSLFVDTGYVRALLQTADKFHDVAAAWQRKIRQERTPLVISTAIFLELGDGFCQPEQWARAAPVIAAFRANRHVTVVQVDEDVFARALGLRNARADKDWGLTDCTSFIIMGDRKITAALSCDHHFQQAKFRALLREAIE